MFSNLNNAMLNYALSLSTTVEINAPVDRVWEVLTTPALIKLYLHGTHCETDWQVGSPISFSGEYEGFKYADHGIIKVNDPLKRIAYTYWTGFTGLEDKPENYCLVTYSFNDLGNGKTEFTWTQEGYVDEAAVEKNKEGMTAFLDHIKEVAES